MSMSAEDVSATVDSSDDQTDAIAELLVGDENTKEKDEVIEEVNKEEAKTDDTDEVEELTEESTEEVEAATKEEEVTWENVLGVDEGQLNFGEDGNLVGVNVKIDGKPSSVIMSDLIIGYQNNKSFTKKSQTLSEERKVFEENRNGFVQQYQTKLKDVDALNQYFEKQLVGEFENIQWDQLRVDNPAEYAALRQDYASRAQDIQGIKDLIGKAQSDEDNVKTQQITEANKTRITEQFNKMVENNPTWTDQKAFTKDMGALKSFCSDTYGFTESDFNLVQDSRLIELIKDASKYRSGVKIANEKIRKTVPHFQKSAGQPSKKVSKLDRLTKAAGKARGGEKRDLQASAVAELITGG